MIEDTDLIGKIHVTWHIYRLAVQNITKIHQLKISLMFNEQNCSLDNKGKKYVYHEHLLLRRICMQNALAFEDVFFFK